MQNKAKAGELTLKEAAKTCISPIADTPKLFKILKSAAICLSFLLTVRKMHELKIKLLFKKISFKGS